MDDLVIVVGRGHKAVFSLQELEAPDAAEQLIEEMSDERMNWATALVT